MSEEARPNEGSGGRIGLRAAWRHTVRALGIIHRLYPSFIPLASTRGAIDAVRPLAVLYLSARILNELAGAREVRVIGTFACLAVSLGFFLALAQTVLGRKLKVMQATFLHRLYFFHSERYMECDFEHVENTKTNETLADIEAKIQGNWLGVPNVWETISPLVQRSVGILLSATLLFGMFKAAEGREVGFVTSPLATAVLALIILLSMIFAFVVRQREQEALKEVFSRNPKSNTIIGYYNGYVGVGMAGKDIRIYAQQPAIAHLFDQLLGDTPWHEFFHRMGRSTGLASAASAFIGACVYLLIGLRGLAGMYAVGSVLQYIGAVTGLTENLGSLIGEGAMLAANAPFLEPLYWYLDLPDKKYLGTLTTEKRSDNDYKVEFHNVSFKYPGSDSYALRNLSLVLDVGKRLAVVGMNGSGKTTMIKLLCRLYDPTEGEITLNGIDIKKYDYQEYMDLFSVVFQDFKLSSLPLGQNVAASTDVDTDRVESSLQKAGFAGRLGEMPAGLDTCLYKNFDPDGIEISGGEAQKIALARALYKDAPFVVLDEPTAALDPIAEFEVYSRFNEIVGGRTAVFISHRLSSCRFCDDIAVFHEGRLVQRDSHERLLQDKGGKYAELWNAQAQYYTADHSAG